MTTLLVASVRHATLASTLLLAACATFACGDETAAPLTNETANSGANGGAPAGGAPTTMPTGALGGAGGAPAPTSTANAGGMNAGGAGGAPAPEPTAGAGGMNTGGTMNAAGAGTGGASGGAGGAADPTIELNVECDPATAGKPELMDLLSLRGNPMDGELQYLDACGFCHVGDGNGKPLSEDVIAPSLHSLSWSCEQVETLANGKENTQMPAFLEDRGAQWVADMIAYVQTAFTDPQP